MNPLSSSHAVLECLEPRLAPAGVVVLTLSNGVLTMTGDTADNDFQITDAGGGMWSVAGLDAGSTTQFRLNGGALLSTVTLAAPTTVKATLGAGNDAMNLTGLHLAGALTINGNDGNDALLLSGTTVNGAVLIDTGAGNDDVDLTSAHLASTVTVGMGAGADYFTAGGDLFFGKGLSVDLGTGANIFELNAATLQVKGNISALAGGTAAEAQSFVFAAGLGTVTGAVTLRTTTASPATFEIGDQAGDDMLITGGFTLQAGAGNDTVTLREKIQVGTLLNIQLGNGANEVVTTDLDLLKAGSLAYGGGTGADHFTLNGNMVSITGNFGFTGGAGTNTLDLNPAVSLRIGGSLVYTGGAGDDTLFIDGPDAGIGGAVSFNGSHGNNYLGFNAVVGSAKSLAYVGGTGTDTVDLGEYTGLTHQLSIHGNVSINAGTNSADIQIRNGVIDGHFTVATNVAFGGIDTVQILESDVFGTTTLNMVGGADGDVVVRDSTFSAVSISMGAGDDYVAFDTDTAVSTMYSAFYGNVRINLGAGNDIFAAGSTPAKDTVGNDFYRSVIVDGGTGFDRVYFLDSVAYNNGFNGPVPLVYNVETYY